MKRHTGWPEHYRPKDLKAMALTDELRERFAWYLAGHVLPDSLFLHGPPGCGKTTIATIIANRLYKNDGWPRVRRIKATETGNVATIRTNVLDSMRAMPGPRLVIFEEASGLSPEAQQALRVPIEEYAEHCRVIFITNESPSGFDGPLRSRCNVIEMRQPPLAECVRVLRAVLKAEGIPATPDNVLAFTKTHFAAASTDLRTLLRAAEYATRDRTLTGRRPASRS